MMRVGKEKALVWTFLIAGILLCTVPQAILRTKLSAVEADLTDLRSRQERMNAAIQSQVKLVQRYKDLLAEIGGLSYDRTPGPVECYAAVDEGLRAAGLEKLSLQPANAPEGRIAVEESASGPYYGLLAYMAALREGPLSTRFTSLVLEGASPDRVTMKAGLEALRR